MKRRYFVQSLMMGAGTILIGSQTSKSPLKVTMLYNNIGDSSKLLSKWGLSMVIEDHDDAILFDTGGEPEILWNNMQKSGFDIAKISKVVISHNHGDHVNGLDAVMEKSASNPVVYVPEYNLEDIRYNFKGANLFGVNKPIQINDFTWSTGQLTEEYRENGIHEQAIIILHDDSVFVFTGCSHPGIVKIVEKTKLIFPDKRLKLVAGGFHMLKYADEDVKIASKKLMESKVEKIAPSHCTGDKAIQIFKEQWKDAFVDFNLEQNQYMI